MKSGFSLEAVSELISAIKFAYKIYMVASIINKVLQS